MNPNTESSTSAPASAKAESSKATTMNVYTGVPLEREPEKQARDNNDDEEYLSQSGLPITHAFGLGCLVGVFIQFSSLGANVLAASSTSSGMAFGWIWSIFTSTLAVVVLWTLRGLLLLQHKTSNSTTLDKEVILVQLELHFAMGALVGVCGAWMGTDLLLGLPHLMYSVVTLVVTLVWFRLMASCLYSTTTSVTTTNESNAPLLLDASHEQPEMEPLDTLSRKTGIKLYSLAMGAVIGLFIQFSSLGANFCLRELKMYDNIVVLSLLWSFLTSAMGVVVLLLVRTIFVAFLLSGDNNRTCQQPSRREQNDRNANISKVLLNMECFFAIGSVIGLNLSWSVTDYLLAMDTHYMQSLWTFVATLVWCKVVFYCTRRCEMAEDTVEEEEEDECSEEEIWVV